MSKKIKRLNRNKKNKISKNRDIEEIVEMAENSQKEENPIENMQQVVEKIDKEQQFRESIKVNNEDNTVINDAITDDLVPDKRLKMTMDRRNAELVDKEKRTKLLKAIAKLEKEPTEEEIQNEKEIQEFFSKIQKDTDEYLKMQDEKGKKAKVDDEDSETSKKFKPNKKEKRARICGTSMEEVFASKEFEKAWEESQEKDEER